MDGVAHLFRVKDDFNQPQGWLRTGKRPRGCGGISHSHGFEPRRAHFVTRLSLKRPKLNFQIAKDVLQAKPRWTLSKKKDDFNQLHRNFLNYIDFVVRLIKIGFIECYQFISVLVYCFIRLNLQDQKDKTSYLKTL